MDSAKFGAFIGQLRKEKKMTQKELAEQLHVTDKAVSKWETGRGFPDMKLMEPLAQILEVSMLELIQCQRQQTDRIPIAEAEDAVAQAIDQSRKATAASYLRLFYRMLLAGAVVCLLDIAPFVRGICFRLIRMLVRGNEGGHIHLGTATVEYTTPWLTVGLPAAALVCCVLLAVRVRTVEKNLK